MTPRLLRGHPRRPRRASRGDGHGARRDPALHLPARGRGLAARARQPQDRGVPGASRAWTSHAARSPSRTPCSGSTPGAGGPPGSPATSSSGSGRRSRRWGPGVGRGFGRERRGKRARATPSGGSTLPRGAGREVVVRAGTSFTSPEAASLNLEAEIGRAGFDEVRARAEAAWESALGRLRVRGGSRYGQQVLYTWATTPSSSLGCSVTWTARTRVSGAARRSSGRSTSTTTTTSRSGTPSAPSTRCSSSSSRSGCRTSCARCWSRPSRAASCRTSRAGTATRAR